jgi:uncharacterized protein YycO
METRKIDAKSFRALVKTGILILIFLGCTAIIDIMIAGQDHYVPEYAMHDLEPMISSARIDPEGNWDLSEAEHKEIFYQTGLGKPAVEALMKQCENRPGEVLELLNAYQKDFFADVAVSSRKFGIITFEEILVDDEGKTISGFRLVPLEDGDIFISTSTHSLGWRHGHAAIVTDAAKGKTMEAVLIGYDSLTQNADKWRKYPSFMLLRMKAGDVPDSEDAADQAAKFARDRMEGLPYGLLTGIPEKAPEPDKIDRTQCAHIVWYPYMQAGYDLDSDGGWLVTPQDIAACGHLEIVQIYGMDPNKVWP